MSGAADVQALTALLTAYLDRTLAPAGRLLDVPPPVAEQAIEFLPGDLPAALASGTAETWPAWTAGWPTWSGPGTDLLVRPLPAGTAVVGLWWD